MFISLKAKARQLKRAGQALPFGIILCDGGCSLLSSTGRSSVGAVSLEDVFGEFFRRNSSVSFVAVLVLPRPRAEPFTGITKEVRITGRLYANPRAARALEAEPLLDAINRGLAQLPPPFATPRDALHWLATADALEGQTINTITHGGSTATRSVTISARKVQELLAGRMTTQQLFADFQHPNSRFENPFAVALKLGLTIDAIKLTKLPNADDDLLEITFGSPDPAIGRIKGTESP